MSRVADARRDLDWLAHVWGDLVESRLKGTPRTWLHHRTSTRRDTNPGDELVTVNGLPAPLHLDVLDAMIDVGAWADETSEHVADVLGQDRLPRASSAYASPVGHLLAHIADRLGLLFADEPTLAEDIAEEARERASRAATLMGLLTGGQRLDCSCPYCGVPGALVVVAPQDGLPLVVCQGRCWMDGDATGHATWRGRRAWSYPDGWAQLAKMLAAS